MHGAKRTFECQICSFVTSNQHNLKAHITALHNKEDQYVCEECGHLTSNLKIHEEHRKHDP